MTDKKVLIITYYWPPSGGSGVQRWLKFVKYLPAFGWEPIVFTPENPSFALRDESLQKDVPIQAEVIHFPIWEPYEAFLRLSRMFGRKKSAKPIDLVEGKPSSRFQKFSTWVRANFFIPDPRVFWVKPASRFLHDFVRDNRIPIIITTGPPHSLHLIGLRLKKKNPSLKWIADFRDPWSEWGFLDSLGVGGLARNIHRKLERAVLTSTDAIFTITPFYVKKFEVLAQRQVTLLTNGFDEDDFKELTVHQTEKFVIRHVGIVNEKCNPRPFILALEKWLNAEQEARNVFHLDFTGEVHREFRAFVENVPAVAARTTFSPSVPHSELMKLYGCSSVLLLVLEGYKDAEGYMPGKLFEYIATGLPVLAIGPTQGDAAQVLATIGQGMMIDASDAAKIIESLHHYYRKWKEGSLYRDPSAAIAHYSRKMLTKRLVATLENIT